MNDNCIIRFEVSNFKKFDHLVIENIGQVNLITGDNNVGKTTLLEALLCNENNLRWIDSLHTILDWRVIDIHLSEINSKNPVFPKDNFLKYLFKNLKLPLECKYTNLYGLVVGLSMVSKTFKEVTDTEWTYRNDTYKVDNAKDWIAFYKNNKINELQWLYYHEKEDSEEYLPLITFGQGYHSDLHEYLKSFDNKVSALDNDEKRNIIGLMKLFIPDIVDYDLKKYGNSYIIGIATEKDKNYQPLTQFGDGVKKFFRYVIEILYAKKMGLNRLMIDEIDVGVHYLKMKDEWKAIFRLAEQTGIQIFATTHSKECIEAFAEAADELEGWRDKIRLIELSEVNENGNIKTFSDTYTIENINASIISNQGMRGAATYVRH